MSPAALLLLAASAAAETGVTGAPTLRRPLSPRPAAMAEAFAGVAGGLDSLGVNPAGVASAERPALQLSYTHGIFDDKFSFTGYAHPTAFGALAGGLAYYDAGSFQLNLANGTRETRKVQQDFVGVLGGGARLGQAIRAGAVAKAYRFNLGGEASASGFAADLGAQWRAPVRGLTLGAALQNLGPDVKFESEGDPLPRTARLGAAYLIELESRAGAELPSFTRFLLAADAISARDEPIAAALGLEMDMPVSSAGHALLRVGHVVNRPDATLSLGVGLHEGRFLVDYAAGVRRSVGNTHQVSVGYRF